MTTASGCDICWTQRGKRSPSHGSTRGGSTLRLGTREVLVAAQSRRRFIRSACCVKRSGGVSDQGRRVAGPDLASGGRAWHSRNAANRAHPASYCHSVTRRYFRHMNGAESRCNAWYELGAARLLALDEIGSEQGNDAFDANLGRRDSQESLRENGREVRGNKKVKPSRRISIADWASSPRGAEQADPSATWRAPRLRLNYNRARND